MLNEKQLKVVNSNNHFIYLLAGAGTGKTTVIINRIKKLLNEGLNAENVLVLSFSRRSVRDLKSKIKDKNILITTFHGLCYRALKKDRNIQLVEDNWLIEKGFSKDEITKINLLKRNNRYSKLVRRYNKFLKENNLLDYTDLENIVVRKLKKDISFKESMGKKFKYIFVDEFQDTSIVQYELLKGLIKKGSRVFCVGDPNQSIYSFRGASKKVINEYIKDFKASVYLLNKNYRSDKDILKLSNNLIKNNSSRYVFDLVANSKELGEITFKEFNSNIQKNNYIITEIRKLLNKGYYQEDIAIIYRNHHFANKIKEEMFNTYFDRINFLTIHQAKGLEYKCVFIIGLEEDKLPFRTSLLEEERRLFYVAITRAKNRLYLLSSNKNKTSRFVFESLKS